MSDSLSPSHHRTIIELHDSFIEGSTCENAMTKLYTMKETNFVGRELGTTGTRNGTSCDDAGNLRLDSKPPSHSRDTLRNEETGEYQKSVAIFSLSIFAGGSVNIIY